MQTKSLTILTIFLVSTMTFAGKSRRTNNNNNNNDESFGWNNNWADDSKTNAYGSANSYGDGYSAVSAGKQGVSTEAAGKNGANSESAFQQNQNSWGVSNGFNNNNNGSNAFNNNWANDNSTQAATKATAYGEGGVKSNVNKDGADVFAQGKNGTHSTLGWNNNDNSWQNSNAFGKKRRLLGQSNHNSSSFGWNNNWADNSATNAAGNAQSNGNGYSAVSAGKNGVSTEAYGDQGAKSASAFNQQDNSWGVSNGFNNSNNGNDAFSNNWASNDATQAVTNAQGFGQAAVKSNANKDGAAVFAQGTQGTQSGLGWSNNTGNWNTSFGFGNKNRRLTSKDAQCSDSNQDNHNNKNNCDAQNKQIAELNKLVDCLKNDLKDLKKENAELKRNSRGSVSGHRVGASN